MRFSLKGKASSPVKKYGTLFSLPFKGTSWGRHEVFVYSFLDSSMFVKTPLSEILP